MSTDPTARIVLWHNRRAWTAGDVVRLGVREGGQTVEQAAAAAGVSPEDARRALAAVGNPLTLPDHIRRTREALVRMGQGTTAAIAAEADRSSETVRGHLLTIERAGLANRQFGERGVVTWSPT